MAKWKNAGRSKVLERNNFVAANFVPAVRKPLHRHGLKIFAAVWVVFGQAIAAKFDNHHEWGGHVVIQCGLVWLYHAPVVSPGEYRRIICGPEYRGVGYPTG